MKAYLIQFEYEMWCQGYEWTRVSILVHANHYFEAEMAIKNNKEFLNARYFKNLTYFTHSDSGSKNVYPLMNSGAIKEFK